MILAKARLIEKRDGTVRVGLTFPTGFDPDDVIRESVRVNGDLTPEAVRVDPRKGNVDDIYRECEVSVRTESIAAAAGESSSLSVTGKFRRGLSFSASLPIVDPNSNTHH